MLSTILCKLWERVMKLDGSQRRQLHQALMHAFRKQEALKQELNFRLDVRLGEITNSQDFTDTVFEVIDWVEAQGRLPELIDAACEYNSGNPELRDFVEQVWKPLQAQMRPIISTSTNMQSDKQALSELVSSTKAQSGT